MSSLNMKLLRELWKLKGQILSIALVVAAGIMSIITMRGAYDSLVIAQQQYYRESRFADLWVSVVRAPESLRATLEGLEGVDAVDTRVTFLATLDLDESRLPAHGRFISVPATERPILNDLRLARGRYISSDGVDEVIISENFALARGFNPGDKVRAIMNGRARDLNIVGIANSPEHTYAVPPGSLYPEDDRYGIFWVSRRTLGPVFNMNGAFNEAFLTLTPDANADAVIESIDDVLRPYGGLGAYPRADQPSHVILQAELDQNRITGAVVPLIFLGVAIFLLYLVLGRMISTQRGEIAVLKAFGYTDWEVGRHFLMYALVAVLLGGFVGTGGGLLLGDAYVDVYGQYFKLPGLEYQPSPQLLLLAFSSCMVGALSGAIAAVRRAVLLPPAEAMRPEAPARFKPGLLERLGFGKLVGATGQMILRNVERKPIQGFLSSLGIALSIAILTIGFFMFDSVNYMMDLQFRKIQREDVALVFNEVQPESVRYDLAGLNGVSRVETQRVMPARLRFGHREDEVVIQGMEQRGELRRIINSAGMETPVPASGAILSSTLAEQLGAGTGDELIVEFLEGKRNTEVVTISGLVDDFLGMSVYMSKESLWELNGESGIASGAFLAVDELAIDDLNQQLKQVPAIAGVASPSRMLQAFQDQLTDGILVAAGFLIGFASIVSIGVVYNAARISLSERGRELASLRVMGFHKNEVAVLLLGEQAFIALAAIPLGWLIGYGMTYALTGALQNDIYRIPFIAEPRTYLLSAVLVLCTAIASGLLVRKKLNQIDIVEVLKTKE